MEKKTAHTPVGLGITAFCAGQHDVEYQEGQQYGEHADELQHGCGGNEAVFLSLCRLDQGREHDADAEKLLMLVKCT